jgi:uncharacterized protein YbgA (DUF1722 family)/uncharacterized protein YbbK (DUF523 family)
VRYDGGHKRNALCHDRLAGFFTLEGVCPEVGIGMGVPRAPIHLVDSANGIRAIGRDDPRIDVTDALTTFARTTFERLRGVSGYIFIRGSPSCGLYDVTVHAPQGVSQRGLTPLRNDGRGIHAAELTRLAPLLPVEENERLDDDVLRDCFVTRVFAYAHWQRLVQAGITAARLIAFHSRYKYLLMAHDVGAYREAGRLLSDLSGDLDAIADGYIRLLMNALATPATRGGHTNVLQHLAGYFKHRLEADARRELDTLVHAYRRGAVPLPAPLGLLERYASMHADDYVSMQVYLEPHPPAVSTVRE